MPNPSNIYVVVRLLDCDGGNMQVEGAALFWASAEDIVQTLAGTDPEGTIGYMIQEFSSSRSQDLFDTCKAMYEYGPSGKLVEGQDLEG